MRKLRAVLVHCVVWLTAATTLLAGTPHLQCRCPNGLLKPVCFASVNVEACCCCGVVQDQDDEAPPSCCQSTHAKATEAAGATFRPSGCQKTLVEPHSATWHRTAWAEPQQTVNIWAYADFSAVMIVRAVNSTTLTYTLPPPLDLHLVLQHFVI
jgi:hypothetical protein